MQFPNIISVLPKENYEVHLTFDDGTEGIISFTELSETEVFSAWRKDVKFECVKTDKSRNIIYWNEEMEISGDALYLRIRNLTFDQWKNEMKHASIK